MENLSSKSKGILVPVANAIGIGILIFVCGIFAGWQLFLRIGGEGENEDFVVIEDSNHVSDNEEAEVGEKTSAICKGFSVDIAGAVVSPGVYCMSEGSTISDVVNVAGGVDWDVVATKFLYQRFNLASAVQNGQKIYIPLLGDIKCEMVVSPEIDEITRFVDEILAVEDESNTEDLCVSINDASASQLMELKGVGESTAQKIIDGRPYSELVDLLDVSGIGEKTLEGWEGQLCL